VELGLVVGGVVGTVVGAELVGELDGSVLGSVLGVVIGDVTGKAGGGTGASGLTGCHAGSVPLPGTGVSASVLTSRTSVVWACPMTVQKAIFVPEGDHTGLWWVMPEFVS